MKTLGISSKTDEQLISDFLKGSNNAMEVIYKRYFNKVFQKCLTFSRNRDDAFDNAQDILMKAFSKMDTFKGTSKFSTWLFAITNNYCITVTAKANKYIQEEIDNNTCFTNYSYIDDHEDMEMKEKNENNLNLYIETIPETDKQLIELKYKQNYSIKELQTEFNLSASAIKMRLMRTRQKLEVLMAKAS